MCGVVAHGQRNHRTANRRMKLRLRLVASFAALAALTLGACGAPPPMPEPTSTPSSTPTEAPTKTPAPTSTAPPTGTPTPTSIPAVTPTETPPTTFISTPAPGPSLLIEPPTPGTSVERQQFQDALNKWQSLGVLEYEMVAKYTSPAPFSGTWDLRVAGDKIEVLSYTGTDGAPATPAVPPGSVNFLTVEQQFAAIQQVLRGANFGTMEAMVDYVATFDPTLGYPSSVQIKARPGVKTPGLESSTVVQKLMILKRGTPTP